MHKQYKPAEERNARKRIAKQFPGDFPTSGSHTLPPESENRTMYTAITPTQLEYGEFVLIPNIGTPVEAAWSETVNGKMREWFPGWIAQAEESKKGIYGICAYGSDTIYIFNIADLRVWDKPAVAV